jgi:hypothetical protein
MYLHAEMSVKINATELRNPSTIYTVSTDAISHFTLYCLYHTAATEAATNTTTTMPGSITQRWLLLHGTHTVHIGADVATPHAGYGPPALPLTESKPVSTHCVQSALHASLDAI